MINYIRKYQQTLMTIVAILVIIAFAWLYNDTDLSRMNSSTAGKIYGRNITQPEFQKRGKMYQLSLQLGLMSPLRILTSGANSNEEAIYNYVINSIVLDHEFEALDIAVTEEEVIAKAMTLPVFQTNGQYDPVKYNLFTEQVLGPYGMSEMQLQDAIRSEIKIEKLTSLLATSALVTEDEVKEQFQLTNRMLHVALVELDRASIEETISPTQEEIDAFFAERQALLESEEIRVVDIAQFKLSEEEQALSGAEHNAAMQKLSEEVNAFTQAMLEEGASFSALVEARGQTITTSTPFTDSKPDATLAEISGAVEEAARLTEELPTSDPVATPHGFTILHLKEFTPSRPLTKEEATPQIVTSIKREKANEILQQNATKLAEELRTQLAENKSVEEISTAVNQQVKALPPFNLTRPNFEIPNWMQIAQTAMDLQVGEVSAFQPTVEGGMLVLLTQVDPAPESAFETEKEELTTIMQNQHQQITLVQWLTNRAKTANFQAN